MLKVNGVFLKVEKNFEETEIECALREFEEETNINKNNINLLDINYIDELYMSTNNIKYKHTYYISQYINKNNKLSIIKNLILKLMILNGLNIKMLYLKLEIIVFKKM